MTTIRALPGLSEGALLNTERTTHRAPDSIALGFQTQLQNQVKLSHSQRSTVQSMQKPSPDMPSHRADTDSMLALLLASKKMLLPPENPRFISGKKGGVHLAEPSMADNACIEISQVTHPEHVGSLCNKSDKERIELKDDSGCDGLISDPQFTCQQPALTEALLRYLHIWVAPEIVRFPVPFYRIQPLRIERVHRLSRSPYRQNGNHHAEEA